jgi:hypothetical protein
MIGVTSSWSAGRLTTVPIEADFLEQFGAKSLKNQQASVVTFLR